MISRILPRTLFGRSLVIIVTPVVLLQLIATYVFYERHWDSVARRLAEGVGGEIAAVVEGMRTLSDEGDLERLIDRARRHMRLKVAFLDRREQPAARAKGDADAPQVVLGDVGQGVEIDLVLAKRLRISPKPEPFEPFADVTAHVCLVATQDAASLGRQA